jgi:hypothetical protein
MSTDFSIKPVGAPVAAPIVQTASSAVDDAVATELPASQSVTVADANLGPQASSDFVSRQAFFDSAAASIVYQVVNSQTDQVVNQFPDDAVLRRRAYFHTLDLTKDTPTRPLATDRTA